MCDSESKKLMGVKGKPNAKTGERGIVEHIGRNEYTLTCLKNETRGGRDKRESFHKERELFIIIFESKAKVIRANAQDTSGAKVL